MKTPSTHEVIKRLVPPLAVWAVGKLLETPRARAALQEVDSRAYVQKRNAMRTVRRASRNAAANRAWFLAGAAAVAIGIGLMAKAVRSPK
jgi:hypothetical protein